LHTRVTGSPETATGTAGHGGSDLRKGRVTQVLPNSSGLAHGSRVQAPGFVGSRVLGTTGVDPPVASAENRVAGVPWVPGSPVHYLPISDSHPPDLIFQYLPLKLSLSPISLLFFPLSLSTSLSLWVARACEEERRKKKKRGGGKGRRRRIRA
jgi:hypothetical protein